MSLEEKLAYLQLWPKLYIDNYFHRRRKELSQNIEISDGKLF